MFENFESAKVNKRKTWATVLLTVSVGVHAVLFTALLIRSFWMIHQLDPPKRESQVSMAPPPPPPPPKGGAKMKDQPKEIKPKKHKVTEMVQPVKVEPKLEDTSSSDSSDNPAGDPNGDDNGVEGGVVGGVVTEAPPPPPPPPPPPAQTAIVAPNVLNANRISGDTQILPDDVTKTEISRSGKTKVIASAKLCLDTAGNVASVTLVKSSGFAAYDDKIRSQMNGWRYRPYTVNGSAVKACTAVTFIYQQH
jgi:hypothetical protein